MIKSFIYPKITEKDRVYGGGIFSELVIKPNGDWRNVEIPNEDQNVAGVESSACYIEAQQSSDATFKEYIYGIQDDNYSARFNALLSGGTENGGDPIKGAMSIKKDGVIPQEMMDWKDIKSWQDFHSWKGVNKEQCIFKGQEDANQWDKRFKIIAEKYTPLETKFINLKEGLKRGLCQISVSAWYERNGQYYKPKGMQDNHFVKVEYVDKDNSIHIKDTYYPYKKVLEPNYDFDFGMYRTLRKLSTEEVLKNIENIVIEGNEKTINKVIARELEVREGEIFNAIKIRRSVEKLMNLQFFETVLPDAKPGSTEGLMSLIFKMKEQRTGMLSVGGGFSTSTKLSIFGEIKESQSNCLVPRRISNNLV